MRFALLLGLLCAIAFAQQPNPQPGAKWTEDQLRAAVAPVRTGRKLTPKSWPNGARVAVCLSFDVDNESYLLAAGQTSPTTLSAADFGAQSGLPRILGVLDKYQVPASFFIPAVERAAASGDDPGNLEKRAQRDRRARLDSRIAARDQ